MNKLTKRNQLDIGLHFNSCNNEISNQKNIDNECLVIVYYVGSQSLAFITNHHFPTTLLESYHFLSLGYISPFSLTSTKEHCKQRISTFNT